MAKNEVNHFLMRDYDNIDFEDTEARNRITQEVKDRKDADDVLQSNIDSETARAENAEKVLQDNIDSESVRAKQAETELQNNIVSESERAKQAETDLQTDIDNEVSRATTAETNLKDDITKESERAVNAENSLQNNIDSEATRAKQVETELQNNIVSESERAKQAETDLQADIDNEVSRATTAETSLKTAITTEQEARISADNVINQKVETKADKSDTVTDVTMTNENGVYSFKQEKNGVESDIGTVNVPSNNCVVELKDTIVENNDKGYDYHTLVETTEDGSENNVANAYIAQNQITNITKNNNILTISKVNQSGTETSQNITLPTGGGGGDEGSSYVVTSSLAINADKSAGTIDIIPTVYCRVSSIKDENDQDVETFPEGSISVRNIKTQISGDVGMYVLTTGDTSCTYDTRSRSIILNGIILCFYNDISNGSTFRLSVNIVVN